jgi:hypothetical protein
VRLVLKESSAQRGREAAAERARGRVFNKPEPRFEIDATKRLCSCAAPWHDGDGGCMYCGRDIPAKRVIG